MGQSAKDGLGFPENTKAAILRRGLQETSSLIQDATFWPIQ